MSIPNRTMPSHIQPLLQAIHNIITSRTTQTLRLIPTLAKYLVYILVLLNARSFPLVWHFKVFRPVTLLRLKYRLHRLSILFKPKHLQQVAEAAWWDSISPIGRNPLEIMVSYRTFASIDDSDFNFHLSNSSYAKTLDSARFKAALQWFPQFFGVGGWCPLAATHYHFIREIPMLSKYEVRVRIGAWDDKWMYIICRFVTKPKKSSKTSNSSPPLSSPPSKPPQTTASTTTSNPTPTISLSSLHTPAEDLTSLSPTPIPGSQSPPNLNTLASSLLSAEEEEEEDGATLHTISVSQICFKFGRITVPPALVLALNGFSSPPPPPPPSSSLTPDDPTLSFMTSDSITIPSPSPSHSPLKPYTTQNPPPHWQTVQSLRYQTHGGTIKKVQDLLKGGWRDVVKEERWWEVALGGEVEERRGERVRVLEGVRRGMEGVRRVV